MGYLNAVIPANAGEVAHGIPEYRHSGERRNPVKRISYWKSPGEIQDHTGMTKKTLIQSFLKNVRSHN